MTQTADWTTNTGEVPRRHGWVRPALVAVAVLAVLSVVLVLTSRAQMQFYFSVGEVQQRSTELVGKALRVSGIVVPDSVQFDPVGLHLEFCLVDQVGGDQSPLRVHMVGQAPPDQMGGEAKAIAEGHLEQDGSFRAEALMMTCASKYQADLSQ